MELFKLSVGGFRSSSSSAPLLSKAGPTKNSQLKAMPV